MHPVPDYLAGGFPDQPFRAREHQRRTPASHGQNDAIFFQAHRLGGPHQREEAFVFVRIPHFFSPGSPVFQRRLHGGIEDAEHLLDALRMQGKTPPGGFVVFIASWPRRLLLPCLHVHVPALGPHPCRLHLPFADNGFLAPGNAFERENAHPFHICYASPMNNNCKPEKPGGLAIRLLIASCGCRSIAARFWWERWKPPVRRS